MKVLLIGNNAFIAEALIKGFLIEKDKIMLVGSFDKKEIDYILMEKIQYYQIDVASDRCEDLFIVNNPDVVVYFDNAQEDLTVDMTETQRLDHINNLINAHYYSVKAKVSRFVYVSTTKLSDTTYNHNKEWYRAHKSCELFLSDFDTHQTTKCIILRTSDIYGYGHSGKKSVITRLIKNQLYNKKEYKLDMDSFHDFIHVDDFCAGVRRSLKVYKSYIFNICSGYRVSLGIIKKTIENINWIEDNFIDSSSVQGVDITESSSLLGYLPKINLLDGIKEVYEQEIDYKNSLGEITLADRMRRFVKKIKKNSKRNIDITNYLLNIALGLLMIYLILHGQEIITGVIDIKLLYIFIIVIFFDFRQALLAVLIAVGVVIYEYTDIEESMILVLYNSELAKNIFILSLAGLGGGLVRQKGIDHVQRMERSERSLREQLNHVRQMYYESLIVKDSLQGQLYNSNNSFGRVFGIMSQMESLELTQLQYQIIQFAEEIMQNRYISFYIINRSGKYLRLVSRSDNLKTLPATIIVQDSEMAQRVIQTQKTYVNKEMDDDSDVVMAAPMFYTNKVVAILVMHKADIEDLTLSYVNMFEITASLANQSFNKAYAYRNAKEEDLYIEGTKVLKVEPFMERIKCINQEIMDNKANAALLDIGTRHSKRYFEKVKALVRDVDFVGLCPTGNVLILLNGINKDDIGIVQNRLLRSGIESQVLDISGWES